MSDPNDDRGSNLIHLLLRIQTMASNVENQTEIAHARSKDGPRRRSANSHCMWRIELYGSRWTVEHPFAFDNYRD